MGEVIERPETPVAASHGTSVGSLIEIISRVASDPTVDVNKLERLLDMHDRMASKQAEVAFNSALSEAQSQMRPIAADAENKQTRSRYATYAKLDGALRPIYTEHGFALSFDTGDAPSPEQIRVLCHVSHRAGFSRTYKVDMPADGKGAKGGDVMTKTHAVGAGMSYGMRYLLKMIFNVAVGEDDTDGNMPGEISVLEAWCQKAQQQTTPEAVNKVFHEGFAVFKAKNDVNSAAAFRKACEARAAELKPKTEQREPGEEG